MQGFEDAVLNCIKDASQTTRGISGAHILNQSVKCDNGRIVESGRHEELIAQRGRYFMLYQTQFEDRQAASA
jgi:ABC-type transport system involved in Fe-S cluster assembly fused permease/ATPase subunit